MAQMSINTDVVGSAVNQISVKVADLSTRTTKFLTLVQDKNSATGGKWSLLKQLENKLSAEVQNVNGIIAAADSVSDALNRYVAMAEEADDDSALR